MRVDPTQKTKNSTTVRFMSLCLFHEIVGAQLRRICWKMVKVAPYIPTNTLSQSRMMMIMFCDFVERGKHAPTHQRVCSGSMCSILIGLVHEFSAKYHNWLNTHTHTHTHTHIERERERERMRYIQIHKTHTTGEEFFVVRPLLVGLRGSFSFCFLGFF